LYHSCTSFEGASRGGQPLNIFYMIRFIGVGGHMYIYIYIYIHAHMHIYIYSFICMYISNKKIHPTRSCMDIYVYIRIHNTYVQQYAQLVDNTFFILIHIHIHMFVYIYIYIHTQEHNRRRHPTMSCMNIYIYTYI